MGIRVNGFEEKVPEDSTISSLIAFFRENDLNLIVERNGQFVHPDKYDITSVSEGDRIEFINPAMGG